MSTITRARQETEHETSGSSGPIIGPHVDSCNDQSEPRGAGAMPGIRTRTGAWLSVCSAAVGICLGACLLGPAHADDQQPAEEPASGLRLTFRMPALLEHLGIRPARPARAVPSDAVLDELREIYRQNGLAMPPMTLDRLDRRPQALREPAPAAVPATVENSHHLEPVAAPPAVDFAPLQVAKPTLALAPTPDPTHVQATLKRYRQRRQISGRSHRGGLKGFCPVALRDRCQLVDGRPEFNVTHQGRMILFSSQEARGAFLAQPTAYLPVAGGIDPVSIIRRRPRMGQLDHATWYRGRLFLFATKANLIEFRQQPGRFTR